MNDISLGKWRIGITHNRAVNCRVVESIYPGVKYPVAFGVIRIKVIVWLKVIYNKEISCRKAPYGACLGTIWVQVIDLINPPVVSGIPRELSGVIALGAKIPGAFIFW